MPALICTQRHNHACMHIRTHGRDHACTYMHTWAWTCPRVYAHIGTNQACKICTHAHNHLLTYTHTWARSRLQEYVHMRAIICSRIRTHKRENAHICMHTYARSCMHVSVRYLIFAVHSVTESGLEYHVFLHVCASPGRQTRKPWHYHLASALLFPCCLCSNRGCLKALHECCHECQNCWDLLKCLHQVPNSVN